MVSGLGIRAARPTASSSCGAYRLGQGLTTLFAVSPWGGKDRQGLHWRTHHIPLPLGHAPPGSVPGPGHYRHARSLPPCAALQPAGSPASLVKSLHLVAGCMSAPRHTPDPTFPFPNVPARWRASFLSLPTTWRRWCPIAACGTTHCCTSWRLTRGRRWKKGKPRR